LHREGGHICAVFQKFYDPNAGRSSEGYRSEGFVQELLAFAGALAESPEFPISRVMVDFYRKLAAFVPGCGELQKAGDFVYSDNLVPILPAGAFLVCCQGDVLGMIEALQSGVEFLGTADSGPYWILVQSSLKSGDELRQVTPFVGQALNLCDGRRTAVEVGRQAKDSGLAPTALGDSTAAEVLLEGLHTAGLVRLILPDCIEPREPVAHRV
jgi:hypothetical protein